jgi:Xaa-Pro aminopeptidase
MSAIRTKRMAQAVQRMHQQGLDGILYATGANFQYLLDWNDYFWQRTCMNNIEGQSSAKLAPEALLYLDCTGLYHVCMIPSAAPMAPQDPQIVLSYMDQFEDTCSRFISGSKIGVGYNCKDFLCQMLGEILPEVQIVDAEHLIDDLRAIKDEKEIRILRENAAFTDAAVRHCISQFHEGMTSWEAEQLLMEYGFRHGCPDFSFPPTAGFKTRLTENATEVFAFDRDGVLVPGTAVAFDVGYMNHGYCSDWGRTVYWGKAPELVKNGYLALQAGQQHMIDSIVPGKTNINQLYGFVLEKVTELGYGEYLRFQDTGSLGHQIGIDCHEFPMLNNSTDYILQPGMVFCSEPKMFFKDECYMRVEDMVLVTETGAESLTKFPRDLFEVGGI